MNGQEIGKDRKGKGRSSPIGQGYWYEGEPPTLKRAKSKSLGEEGDDPQESFSIFDVGDLMKKRRENSKESNVLSRDGSGSGGSAAASSVGQSMTPLRESRRIYRSHREIRIAIIESSKRFEMMQERRETRALLAHSKAPPSPVSTAVDRVNDNEKELVTTSFRGKLSAIADEGSSS